MGFLSNLKNNLTGSWADVSLTAAPATRGDAILFNVHVSVKDEAIDIDKVVVQVRCTEMVEVKARQTTNRPSEVNGKTATRTSPTTVRETETLFTQDITVAHAQQLAANAQQHFEATVQLPAHLPPTFTGRNARIEWKAMASVDMKGNDPDSGWQTFEVR
ncbi:MAG: sporulation protein [Rhodothermaceae bacterium]|nr:sporulation protein [Rhodothermaceae bacterium]